MVQPMGVFMGGNKNEEGKTYPPVGEYEITFSYEKQEVKVSVKVTDTTAPKFIDFKGTIDTCLNNKVDFETSYAAEDLGDVTITYDDSTADYAAVKGAFILLLHISFYFVFDKCLIIFLLIECKIAKKIKIPLGKSCQFGNNELIYS